MHVHARLGGKPTQIGCGLSNGSGPHGRWTGRPIGSALRSGGNRLHRRASLRSVTHEWMQPEGEAAFSLIEGGIERRDLRRASALVGAGAVAPGWLTSPGVVAAAAPAGRDAAGAASRAAGRSTGRYLRSTLGDRPLGRAARRRTASRRRPSSPARLSPSTPFRTRASSKTRAATRSRTSAATASRASRCSRTRARSPPPRASPRRPVCRHRPDRRPRRRARRHPAGRRARPRPARAVRRRLQPPRGRRAHAVSTLHAGAPGRRRLPRATAGLTAAARRVPARSLHGDHGRRGRRADVQRGPRRRLEPVPAGARARARSSSPAIRTTCGGPFALEAPLRATFRLTVLPRGPRAPRRDVADYWVARTRAGRADAALAARVADLPRRGARDAARAGLRAPRAAAGTARSRAGPSRAARSSALGRFSSPRGPCRRAPAAPW